jgi:murein DD-endopeptidase MepM/ murein hydrolase activator NlpD
MIKKGIIFFGAFSFTMFLTTLLETKTYASTLSSTKNVSWIVNNDQIKQNQEELKGQNNNFNRKYSDKYTIETGDTIKGLLRKSQIDTNDINQFVYKTKDAKKFLDLKAGQEITIERDQNNQLLRVLVNNDNYKILQVKRDKAGTFQISETDRDYKLVKRYVAGKINSSLSQSAKKMGLSSSQVNQLTTIFAWDIDFKYDLKQGDTFAAVFEQKVVDDKIVGTGDILAAEFDLEGRKFTAYLHESNGQKKYYTEDGQSLQKAFLRNPIDFAKISSNFNATRLHPVFKKLKAHKGTDYAAATGTPIKNTGDGIVSFVGQQNGYGNVVMIDHGRGYSTVYAHMSKFQQGLKEGQTINQGEVIGFVGTTGYATGPHLHYEFKINGIAQNALTVDLPTAQPLDKTQMAQFKKEVTSVAVNMNMIKGATFAQAEKNIILAQKTENTVNNKIVLAQTNEDFE